MKSFKCPPAGYTIDLGVARFQASVLMVLSALCLAMQEGPRVAIAIVAILDLLPRALSKPQASPTSAIGKRLLKSLGFHPRRVDAAPRRFTARVAALLMLGVAILSAADRTVASLVCAGVIFVASSLDALFDISIGTRMHAAWWSVFGRPRSPDQF